jgi:hypothetical protein
MELGPWGLETISRVASDVREIEEVGTNEGRNKNSEPVTKNMTFSFIERVLYVPIACDRSAGIDMGASTPTGRRVQIDVSSYDPCCLIYYFSSCVYNNFTALYINVLAGLMN